MAAAIAKLDSGKESGRDVEVIALARSLQAVQALEVQFVRTTDIYLKSHIANALVRLGDKDDTYWKYLLEQATFAVDSNIPDPEYSESQKQTFSREPSPELKAWAKAHDVTVQVAAQYASFDFPGKIVELGQTGDPRGIPILRRALQSRNSVLVNFAAKGLAQIQDKESIPLIIAASQSSPDKELIALSLVYFDDQRARSAASIYLHENTVQTFREAIAQGLGPFGYGWQESQ